MYRAWIASAAYCIFAATTAQSQILAEHIATPLVDEIRLTNVAECNIGPVDIAIFFEGSAGSLSIASTPVGRLLNGPKLHTSTVEGQQDVMAEDDMLYLEVATLAPGEVVSISVKLESDYDEQELSSFGPIDATIAGAETVVLGKEDEEWVGLFGRNGLAMVDTNACRF